MKRVLILEGGGANGIRQAVIADELERAGGASLLSKVDLVAATSTGADQAALMLSNFTAGNAVDFYEQNLPAIFSKGARGLTFGFAGISSVYKHDKLRESLERYVKIPVELTPTKFVFPTREGLADRANVFIKGHSEYWHGFPLALAALASSCAQVYFNGLEVEWRGAKHRFQDGGMIENNPVTTAYTECKRLGWGGEKLVAINLGCGRPYQAKFSPSPNGGILTWKGGLELMQELMDAQSELSENSGPASFDEYYRVNPFRRVAMGLDCGDLATIRSVIQDTRAWCREPEGQEFLHKALTALYA